MAICKACNQDMSAEQTVTCTENIGVLYPDGTFLSTIPHYSPDGSRCPDCGVASGGYHHPGCALEICGQCGDKIISCGCLDKNGN